MKLTTKISCVFPVHNEAQVLSAQIKKFFAQLKEEGLAVNEVILVENGSVDTTWQIIERLQRRNQRIRALRLDHASYGEAVKLGLEAVRGDAIFVLNIDFYNIAFMKEALQLLKVADIVIASKTLGASDDQRSFMRRWVTYFFNVLLRLVLNYPGTDTHGIKALRKSRLLQYALLRCRTRHELFDTELIIRMTRWGARLIELPITVREIRPSRYSVSRRLLSTALDLFSALWSKYLIPLFSQRIVIADDYGISNRVNKAVLRLSRKGLINIVSILPNFVTEGAVKSLKEIPRIRYSAHLNLVEGKPVSAAHRVRTLVNQKRIFYTSWYFFWRLLFGRVNLKEVEIEYAAQIRRLRNLGIVVTHLDGHQHWHLFPPLWNIVLKLARRFKIDEIRSYDSARYYLRAKPFRYLGFLLMYFALKLRHGGNDFSTWTINEIIVHPGTDYDRQPLDNPPKYR